MKKVAKNLVIYAQVYPFKIMFSFSQSNLELCSSLQESNIGNDQLQQIISKESSCININGSDLIIIRLDNTLPGPIAKEIFNAVSIIMFKLRIETFLSDKYAHSFLIGYITEKLYEKLFK